MVRRLTLITVTLVIAVVIIVAIVWTLPAPDGGDQPNESVSSPSLARDGAFGFPQAEAMILFDDPNLRVSAFSDARFLYVQAVVWADGDDAPGETEDGRAIGDRSYLRLDVDADLADTPDVDRVYSLAPWPSRRGLHYQVARGGGAMTHLQRDSQGRGAIKYVGAGNGARARVDCFLIPLSEIGRQPGQTLRLAYWTRSPSPDLTLNSLGVPSGDPWDGRTLPRQGYHLVTLAERRTSLDPMQVPGGRDETAAASANPDKALPRLGATPPEITAADWINADGPQTLGRLRGQVVLIDFWSTSCGQCLEQIPHLNELHERYGPRGLRILAFTAQSRRGIEWFMQNQQQPIAYTVGTGSDLKSEYGVPNVPYAFVVGRDGRLLWHGRPSSADMENRLLAALAE
jgi:thiol-disulfide isomerase/thioredoxin